MNYANMEPTQVRTLIRQGKITGQTAGMCNGYAQANLCVLPREYAYDFLLFAQRNPAPCPILEVSDPGDRLLRTIAKGADIATDFPKYRIYVDGVLTEEVTDAAAFWREDLVSFLIGCSFSFEGELLAAGDSRAPHRRGEKRSYVSHEYSLSAGRRVSWEYGGVHASHAGRSGGACS